MASPVHHMSILAKLKHLTACWACPIAACLALPPRSPTARQHWNAQVPTVPRNHNHNPRSSYPLLLGRHNRLPQEARATASVPQPKQLQWLSISAQFHPKSGSVEGKYIQARDSAKFCACCECIDCERSCYMQLSHHLPRRPKYRGALRLDQSEQSPYHHAASKWREPITVVQLITMPQPHLHMNTVNHGRPMTHEKPAATIVVMAATSSGHSIGTHGQNC